VLISSAAHVQEILTYPFEQAASPAVDYTHYIDASARLIAGKLKTIKMKPDSLLVYMTSSAGIENFTNDCSLQPAETPLPYGSLYNWDKIPYMQSRYVQEFRQVAEEEMNQTFLVLDMQHMVQMRRGCRGDFVHGHATVKASPYFNNWLVLYNLLVEYRKEHETAT
jgi:hypothetical protein